MDLEKMDQNGVTIDAVLEALFCAVLWWEIEEFARVYGITDYDAEDPARHEYVAAKWRKFGKEPALFYAQLDPTNKKRFHDLIAEDIEQYRREAGKNNKK